MTVVKKKKRKKKGYKAIRFLRSNSACWIVLITDIQQKPSHKQAGYEHRFIR